MLGCNIIIVKVTIVKDKLTPSRNIEIVAKKIRLGEEESDALYWRSQSYQARIQALEEIRQEYHSWKYNDVPRFQRIYSIIKR